MSEWQYAEDTRSQEQREADYQAFRARRNVVQPWPRERTERPDPRRAAASFDHDHLFLETWR